MLCSDPQPEIFPTQKLLFASICTTKIRRHDIFVPNKLQTTLTQEQFSLDFFPRSTSACTHKTWRRRLRWFIKRRTETFLGKFLCQQFWFTQKTAAAAPCNWLYPMNFWHCFHSNLWKSVCVCVVWSEKRRMPYEWNSIFCWRKQW